MTPCISTSSKDGYVPDLDADAGESGRPGPEDMGGEHLSNRERRLGTGDSSLRLESLPAEPRSHILKSTPARCGAVRGAGAR